MANNLISHIIAEFKGGKVESSNFARLIIDGNPTLDSIPNPSLSVEPWSDLRNITGEDALIELLSIAQETNPSMRDKIESFSEEMEKWNFSPPYICEAMRIIGYCGLKHIQEPASWKTRIDELLTRSTDILFHPREVHNIALADFSGLLQKLNALDLTNFRDFSKLQEEFAAELPSLLTRARNGSVEYHSEAAEFIYKQDETTLKNLLARGETIKSIEGNIISRRKNADFAYYNKVRCALGVLNEFSNCYRRLVALGMRPELLEEPELHSQYTSLNTGVQVNDGILDKVLKPAFTCVQLIFLWPISMLCKILQSFFIFLYNLVSECLSINNTVPQKNTASTQAEISCFVCP